MDTISKKLNKGKWIKWLRLLHRDLGYFFVGISLVYAISGILLTHRGNNDPAYSIKAFNDNFPAHLSPQQIKTQWDSENKEVKLNKTLHEGGNIRLFLKGGQGSYNPQTGEVYYEVYKKRPLVEFINKLHYNQKTGWKYFADFFAISLIFFAVSGLFLVQGKNGFRRRGIWIMLAGMAVLLIFYLT